jgi:D-alanyl-D-alanine carboxypeptidase/D-alanyl-D-alanine-endopeptidase (penicillin-binding protein 4)
LVALLSLLGLAFAVPLSAPADRSDDALGKDIDAILGAPSLRGTDIGLLVRKADGTLLYDRGSDQRRQPASNAKLLSAAASLQTLGAAHRFDTSVSTTTTQAGPVAPGDLYLRGGGDPTMLAADYDRLAASVARRGIRVVQGKLVADDSYFDDVRLAPGWAWDDEPYSYNAQISALTIAPDTDYDAGSVIVTVSPGAQGARPKVTMTPPNSYVHLENTATTAAEGTPSTLKADRAHGDGTITVTGAMPAGSVADKEYMAVWKPTEFAAAVFRDALARHGVHVLGATTTGTTPSAARRLADHRSMTVGTMLTPFLKLSNNMHAEALVKTMARVSGKPGDWADGIDAERKALPSLGVDAAQLSIVDGSGLSRMDEVSPARLVDLLRAARNKPWFQEFYDALPIAGAGDRLVGGTLRNRMKNTPAQNNVHAKTGSYTGASALSGYVTAADGEPLVFSMITNQALDQDITAVEDAVAVRLARYRGSEDTHVPAPRFAMRQVSPQRAAAHPMLECSWQKVC